MYAFFKESFWMCGFPLGNNNNSTLWDEQSSKYAHLPLTDILLMVIFTLSLKAWVLIIMWFILAPVAHRWDLGPLYVCLLSSFLLFYIWRGGEGRGLFSHLSTLPMHSWDLGYWTLWFSATLLCDCLWPLLVYSSQPS